MHLIPLSLLYFYVQVQPTVQAFQVSRNFFLIYLFLFASQIYGEERQRERSSVLWLPPQVATIVTQSWEPRASPRSPRCPLGAGSHGFVLFSAALWGLKQGTGRESEQPLYKQVPLWDPGTCKGRSLATRIPCWATLFIYTKGFNLFIFFKKNLLFFPDVKYEKDWGNKQMCT